MKQRNHILPIILLSIFLMSACVIPAGSGKSTDQAGIH